MKPKVKADIIKQVSDLMAQIGPKKREPVGLKVAIVGWGNGRLSVPSWDTSWEIWAVNDAPALRVTRRFELHRRHHLRRDFGEDGLKKYLQRVAKRYPKPKHGPTYQPVYVWSPEEYPELKDAEAYPLSKVSKLPRGASYHAWSPDWMIAMAIAMGAKQIALHGIEPTHTGEPPSARACTEYWLGVAEGRGIKTFGGIGSCFKIYALHESERLYGFDDWRMVERDLPGRVQ